MAADGVVVDAKLTAEQGVVDAVVAADGGGGWRMQSWRLSRGWWMQ
jgi:hypothetical protein